MAITYGNVDNWLKKSNVKGFALTAYPTPGKPYTFNLKHTVVGNRADVYQTKLVSDIVPQLPGGAPVRRALSRSAGNRWQPPQRSS